MNPNAIPVPAPAPSKARSRWPAFVIGLLTLQALGVGALIRFAVSDENFAVEPGYYERALGWDHERASRDRAVSSGWTWDASLRPESGTTVFELALAGATPVEDAVVTVDLFPTTRPKDRHTCRAVESEPGRYTAVVPTLASGLWEVRITCTSKGHEYIHLAAVEAARPEAAR